MDNQDYTSPALPEHIHELLEGLEHAAIFYAEKRPDAEAARLLDSTRVTIRTEIAELVAFKEKAGRDQEDVIANAQNIWEASERALDMIGSGDGEGGGLPDWKEVAAALVTVKFHAETLRLDVGAAEKVELAKNTSNLHQGAAQ